MSQSNFHCDSICLCTECIRLGANCQDPENPNDRDCSSSQTSGLLSFSCLLSSSFCAFSGSYLLAERLRLTTKKMTTRTTTARRIPITIGTRSPLEFLSVGSMEFGSLEEI